MGAHPESSKLNIVFIIARFHPFKGGAEQNCWQLATRAAAAGHHVTVLTTDASLDGQPLPPTEEIFGITIIRCHRWNQELNLGFYPSLLSQLLKLNADIVHVENGPGFIWHEFCIWIKRLRSPHTKFIITPHGPFLVTPETHGGWKTTVAGIVKFAMAPYFKFLWHRLWDIVIQVNPRQYKWLTTDYGINPDKIKLLPNGINADMLIEPSQKVSPLVEVGISYLGRIARYKGVHHLIKALGRLKEANPAAKWRLFIMGKTQQPEILADIAKLGLTKHIEILENPSDAVRDRILSEKSHIFVLPSQWEATGIVLLEAMAKGNAVITTRGNEAHELIIADGENGFVYDYGNVAELDRILERLIVYPELLKSFQKHSLQHVNNFTWENIFPTYEALIGELFQLPDNNQPDQDNQVHTDTNI